MGTRFWHGFADMHVVKDAELVIRDGHGAWVTDVEGRRYLDMLAAYSALNFGHGHPRLIAAAQRQLKRLTLISRAFQHDQFGPFCAELADLAGLEVVLPMNTGAEAVETAIKVARKWGYTVKGVPRDQAVIIAFDGNFHGRTTTIISFSSDPDSKKGFGPFTPGFTMVPYNDVRAVERAITPKTVGILVEPIQGEAGINIPSPGYLKELRRICDEHGILLILDEIQTGWARTGKMFAFMHEGIKPDVLCVGKALGGGLYPVSASLARKDIMDVFTPGSHGSTFGGNPLAAAIGEAAIDVLVDEKLARNAEKMGAYFRKRLEEIRNPKIKEIRQKGLLIGVEFHLGKGETVRPICERLMAKGVLAKDTHEKTVRFAPPLVITKADIDWAIERIKPVFEST